MSNAVRHVARMTHGSDLGDAEKRVLMALTEVADPQLTVIVNPRVIAAAFGYDKRDVEGIVYTLESRGYLTRTPDGVFNKFRLNNATLRHRRVRR